MKTLFTKDFSLSLVAAFLGVALLYFFRGNAGSGFFRVLYELMTCAGLILSVLGVIGAIAFFFGPRITKKS
ncbi:MAG: hypothetical protein ACK5N8_00390 [Alphaproteobacteria bacterium]